MRKILFTLASVIMIASVSFADNALYIYRNDGSFNAFLDSDIDSMAYSTIDTSGVDHQRHVTQLIYTPDSLYQIPLSAIDSIAFTERPVKYTPQVVKITEEYLPYILSADSLQIQFSTTLPSNLRPYNGDILLYEGFSETFPNGFVGRITDITETSSAIIVECEEVYIDEVYESLTFVSDYVLENTPDEISQYSLRQVTTKSSSEASASFNLGLNFVDGEIGSFKANYKGSLKVRAVVNINENSPFYSDISCTSTHAISGEIKMKTQRNFSWNTDKSIKVFDKTLPLPNCPVLKFDYVIAPFVKGSMNGSFSVSIDATSSTTNGVIFRGAKAETYKRNNGKIFEPQLNEAFNVNGSIFCGAICSANFGTVGNFLGLETNLYVGPRITGNQSVDLVSLTTESVYDAVKDAQIEVSLGAELEAKAKLKLLKWEIDKVFAKAEFNAGLLNWYLYPLFSTPQYEAGDDKTIAIITAKTSRELLMPVQVGMRLYDGENNLLATKYHSADLSDATQYSIQFDNIEPGTKYKCYPMLKIFGMEMQASPTKEFTTEKQEDGEILDRKAVDLGLSVKWAGWNVGATSPEEYGGYYAWGETEEKSNYDWPTYKYGSDSDGDGKANLEEIIDIGSNISGTKYDVARKEWGGSWRMPTYDEIKELCSKCTWTWTTYNGVNGYQVTGPNGNSIFLPASGTRYKSSFLAQGKSGCIWSGTIGTINNGSNIIGAWFLTYGLSYESNCADRYRGFTVRPVK